jgi:DNA-binding LacI/PurR family transcriptional regulator
MADLIISRTKTQQLSDYLEEKIRSGQLRHGERLQTVRELAASFNVSTIVVNAAYGELEKKNLVERCGRRGVFVNDPQEQAKCFLIANYTDTITQKESPATYILPEFKAKCISLGIRLEEIHVDSLYSASRSVMIRRLKERNYDGVLSFGSGYIGDEPDLEIFRELGVPVLIPRMRKEEGERLGFNCFYSNEKQGWFDAMKLLAGHGYQKIGALGIYQEHSDHCMLRCGDGQEHLKMLRSLKLGGDNGSICFLAYKERELFQRELENWLGDVPKFDAIMCYSDFFAIRLYEYCRNHRIRIPEDLAIIGFCGYPGGNLMQPGLSTIDIGYAEIGRKAVDFLLNAGKGVRSEEIPYKVVERGSTAPRQYITN